MALIDWNDSLSVKVKEIDQQHQKLISMVNALDDAMKQGQGKDIIGKVVNGLISYTAIHFKTEENYFAKFDYPETEKHVKAHVDFVQKVSDFKDGFEQGKLGLSIEVMNFLGDWLKNHIMGVDKEYSQFFNDKGLT